MNSGKTDLDCLSIPSVKLQPEPIKIREKWKKKRKKTTCNLVINPKIAVQREQQQPSKLQSNFSFMLQAPGFKRLWRFCRPRKGGG